ncbi:electron transporter RnfD, partial [bacterium]|nr:electron transporter RnfD [bacterium]
MTNDEVTPARMHVAPSPHIAAKENVTHIMLWVVGALMPVTVMAVVYMGWVAAQVILASIITCLASEWVWNALRKRPQTLTDGSALVTGLLIALVMPPHVPVWIVVAAGIVAILLAKQI